MSCCISRTDGVSSAIGTWAEVLARGNTSGGSDPTITTGDSIVGQTDLPLVATGAGTITLASGGSVRVTLSAAGDLTHTGDLTLSGATPSLTLGDGTGDGAEFRIRKSVAGNAYIRWMVGAATLKWQLVFNASELLAMSRYDDAGVLIEQAFSINDGTGLLDWTRDIRAEGILLDGDTGGTAGTITLTNVVDAAGDTAAVLGNWRVNASAGTFHGWIKVYDGITYVSVPCWVA